MPNNTQDQPSQDELRATRDVMILASLLAHQVSTATDNPRVCIAALLLAIGQVYGACSLQTTSAEDWKGFISNKSFELFCLGWKKSRREFENIPSFCPRCGWHGLAAALNEKNGCPMCGTPAEPI